MLRIDREQVKTLLPAIVAGIIAWVAFIAIGNTPVTRATGMALAVVGMGMALRPMGGALAVIGALALAFSPSFWVQTGGAQSLVPLEVVVTLVAAVAVGVILLVLRRRPAIALVIAAGAFAIIYLTAVGSPRSLRVTTVLAVWLIYLLTEGSLASNKRADETQPARLDFQHTYGLLLLLAVGVANDPLFILFAPAVALSLFLSQLRLPIWFWGVLAVITAIGVRGIALAYISPEWWTFPHEQSPGIITHVPFLISEAWREPHRWIRMIEMIVGQFTVVGLILGVLGLARLSRWHPPVGVVTMVAYGAYLIFGLLYFGEDAPVLLLPLLMIQVYWMTYAAYTFAAWLRNALRTPVRPALVWTAAAFALLPLFMLLRIVGIV